MLDWQKQFVKILAGRKPGEIIAMTSGRKIGKSIINSSILNQMFNEEYFPELQDIRLSTGTIMDVPYYTAEPVGGSWGDLERWVRATFGEPGDVWNIGKSDEFAWPNLDRWYMNNSKFWFREESDRTLFVIKWR